MRLYCDFGMNLDERFMIWNDAWYVFRASPVTRRATCVAGLATSNRMADERLREGVCRQGRQDHDDRQRRPSDDACHRPQHTPHPF
jgi:hypothetical protein